MLSQLIFHIHFAALFVAAEQTMGPVEILFNCAGIIEELNWQLSIDVNIVTDLRTPSHLFSSFPISSRTH